MSDTVLIAGLGLLATVLAATVSPVVKTRMETKRQDRIDRIRAYQEVTDGVEQLMLALAADASERTWRQAAVHAISATYPLMLAAMLGRAVRIPSLRPLADPLVMAAVLPRAGLPTPASVALIQDRHEALVSAVLRVDYVASDQARAKLAELLQILDDLVKVATQPAWKHGHKAELERLRGELTKNRVALVELVAREERMKHKTRWPARSRSERK